MKTQTNQPQKTQGKTTKQEQIQTQDNKLLSPKAGYDQHASP